jgi:hypothetical protein
MTIAALFVDRRGPYWNRPDVDAWDVERDARKYAGPYRVVAHPPCGPWGRLKHLYKGNEHDCAPRAVEQVRSFGGVLEHPARSLLWERYNLPTPGSPPDEHGGFSVEVDQCAWGHVARKSTWLYIVGARIADVVAGIRTGGTPTHWVSGSRTAVRGPVPPGIKVCSAQQRRRTPTAFAEWLLSIARSS